MYISKQFMSRAARCVCAVFLAFGLVVTVSGCQTASRAAESKKYFPAAGNWVHHTPSQEGMDDAAIADAVAWAAKQENDMPRDFSAQERIFGRLLGPIPSARAATNGVIIRHGYIIAEFGDVNAVDPTYSCAKSYLSTILGLTIDRGMIKSIDDPVKNYIHDGGYDSEHNSKITWRHHATQTSEWEGEMFGKVSTFIGKTEFGGDEQKPKAIQEPGTRFEYNDVRVNRFSLSMLRLWKRPLPDVLKTEIMDKIGASSTWRYIPYNNAMVDVDGMQMPSVSGGTRWGGGLWINSLDHARFGLLFLNKGNWNGKQIISRQWVEEATKHQGVKSDYGYLWWLNNEGKWPAAPRSSFCALGAGGNSIFVDPEHDLVIVWRWAKNDAQAEFYRRVIGAIVPEKTTLK